MRYLIGRAVRLLIYIRFRLAFRRWNRHAERDLQRMREERKAFEERLYVKWARGLDWLDVLWQRAHEEAEAFSHRQQEKAVADEDLTFEALRSLHARACRVSSEVAALLRTGHAEGAMARWRTLHEIAVVMEFIRDHGNDVAERYLLHGNARSYAGMQEYDRHAVQLGSEPFSQEHREDARATKDALIARFGKAYTDQYGWAASVLPRTRKGQPAGPTFAQIEEAVAMQASRPWYRFASEGQHAGVGALDFTLGLTHGPPLLLVGASDMGMFDPGTNTGRTLLHATTTFLGSRPDVRAVSAMFLVVVLGRQLEDAFWQAYQSIDYGEGDDHLASAAE